MTKRSFHKLSLRISLLISTAVALLLAAAIGVMLYYSKQAIKEEALAEVEQTLDTTVQCIDKIMLSVEQSVNNVYADMQDHLDRPEMIADYCKQLAWSNPYILGSAVAMEPYFYKQRGQYFLNFVRKVGKDSLDFVDTPIMQARQFHHPVQPSLPDAEFQGIALQCR